MIGMDESRALQVERAKELVRRVEAGDAVEISRLLDEISRDAEHSLFQELGRLTRELHEALNSFRTDSRIVAIAELDIPDAKERLNYVVSMTEQAANRTLTAVEESLPVSGSLTVSSRALAESWRRFRERDMSADEFRTLSQQIEAFLEQSIADSEAIHRNLNEIMMAQDFQDLTGQIIRRVVRLVEEVEDNLVGLIRISGQKFAQPEQQTEGNEKEMSEADRKGQGPAVPGVDKGDNVKGQDDVDSLLSSLGF